MKNKVLALLSAGVVLSLMHANAASVKTLLVVQNHVSEEFKRPLSSLAARLSAALSGDMFSIIDPADAIGDSQNVKPSGESMPLSSATRLAENCGADALITASIDEMSVESFGNPVRFQRLRATMTLQAKRLPDGEATRGVTVTVAGDKRQVSQFSANKDALYSDLITKLIAASKSEFLSAAEKVAWTKAEVRPVEVAFACNYAGADVSIDGVSYGTAGIAGQAPLKVKVTPGVHNLKVSYPFTIDYSVRAKFVDGSTYLIELRENAEGRELRKRDTYFAALMDRIAKSGATDDEVRLIKAKGYGAYLAASHTRIAGMPQTLQKWMWNSKEATPDFGLQGGAEIDGKTVATENLMKEAAAEIKEKK